MTAYPRPLQKQRQKREAGRWLNGFEGLLLLPVWQVPSTSSGQALRLRLAKARAFARDDGIKVCGVLFLNYSTQEESHENHR
jgi:hypothetical protein